MDTSSKPVAVDLNLVVAANLRAEVARERWNGNKIATALGLTPMYVSRRLSGDVAMSPADLVLFANLLRIPVARLFAETQDSPTPNAGVATLDTSKNAGKTRTTDYGSADSVTHVDFGRRKAVSKVVS